MANSRTGVPNLVNRRRNTELRRQLRTQRQRASLILSQIEELVLGSPGGQAALALAAGVTPTQLSHWMSGETSPKLEIVERLLGVLGFTAVLVPCNRAPFGAHIRDLLTCADRNVYDAQTTDTNEILDDNLRLLQLELIALKKQHLCGAIDDPTYRSRFDRLQASLLATVETLARARIAGVASGEMADEVEFIYGSPRGPGYAEFNEKVQRANRARAELPEAGQTAPQAALPATTPGDDPGGKE